MLFFKNLKLPEQFLLKDPSEWSINSQYIKNRRIVNSLHVVNDVAERCIGMIKNYKDTITKSDDCFQKLLVTNYNFLKSKE